MQESYSTPLAAQNNAPLVKRGWLIAGIVVILLLTILIGWGVIWAAINHPDLLEALRDVMIIALALGSCLMGLSLILITIMIIRLVNMLEFEIKPILHQTNETLAIARGTTDFVSQSVVKPVARLSGYAAGLRRGAQALFGDPRNNLPE